jgi:hypothetical protein
MINLDDGAVLLLGVALEDKGVCSAIPLRYEAYFCEAFSRSADGLLVLAAVLFLGNPALSS